MPQQFEPQETTDETPIPIIVEGESLAAETVISRQDEATFHRLLNEYEEEIRRHRRKLALFLLPLIVWVGSLLIIRQVTGPFYSSSLSLILMLLTGILMLSGMYWIRRQLSKPVGFNYQEFTRVGGVHAIGPLLNYVGYNNVSEESQLRHTALTVLLPQLKATDKSLLTPKQHRSLLDSIRYSMTPDRRCTKPLDFVLAVLKALEQVGGSEALPVVEHLATEKTHNDYQRRIQQAAQECLPYLKANAGIVSEQQTLLRPSSAEKATPDTLLRPAHFTDEAPSTELLRPSRAVSKQEDGMHE